MTRKEKAGYVIFWVGLIGLLMLGLSDAPTIPSWITMTIFSFIMFGAVVFVSGGKDL